MKQLNLTKLNLKSFSGNKCLILKKQTKKITKLMEYYVDDFKDRKDNVKLNNIESKAKEPSNFYMGILVCIPGVLLKDLINYARAKALNPNYVGKKNKDKLQYAIAKNIKFFGGDKVPYCIPPIERVFVKKILRNHYMIPARNK